MTKVGGLGFEATADALFLLLGLLGLVLGLLVGARQHVQVGVVGLLLVEQAARKVHHQVSRILARTGSHRCRWLLLGLVHGRAVVLGSPEIERDFLLDFLDVLPGTGLLLHLMLGQFDGGLLVMLGLSWLDLCHLPGPCLDGVISWWR